MEELRDDPASVRKVTAVAEDLTLGLLGEDMLPNRFEKITARLGIARLSRADQKSSA